MAIEDKILDLGVTLEMLLLDDDLSNNELSLAFRLRGSWLLGGDIASKRIEIYEQLRELYRYRSQVAHSGMLCKGNMEKINNVRQSFSKYQTLAEDVCRKIIKEGKPNWDKIVLNAT